MRGSGSDTEPHVVRAEAALARGDFAGAAGAFRQAIAHRTRNPHVYNNLAVILAQAGDLDGAIPLFRRALELMPDLGSARENLASALEGRAAGHYRKKQWEDAAEDFRALLEVVPSSA